MADQVATRIDITPLDHGEAEGVLTVTATWMVESSFIQRE